MEANQDALRAYVEYLRDLGVYDLYRRGEAVEASSVPQTHTTFISGSILPVSSPVIVEPLIGIPERRRAPSSIPPAVSSPPLLSPDPEPSPFDPPMPKLISFTDLAPLPASSIPLPERANALIALQNEIGDCTRCPLAYAGRRKIVFGNGDPGARLMFVGEGPGADEDATGEPFVGKAGQLLNNMIQAMGLKREQVYVANIVKCRPPANRVPEPVEANTCSQFLVRQIDIVQPQVIVALGATAALYLLGVKRPLMALRGQWHECRGAKLAVTYHPAFLLRDPRQKSEAWKDLQRVMAEMGLEAPKRPA